MKFVSGEMSKTLARVAVVALIATSAGACSSLPGWLGGDETPTTPTDANGFPVVDQSAAPAQTASTDTAQPADGNTSGTAAPATGTAQPPANSQFPDLADTPDRPAAASTPDDQKQTSDTLSAEGNKQNYSADQLRAGTEVAAAPPPDKPEPVDQTADVAPSKADTADTSTADNSSTAAAPTAAPVTPVTAAQTTVTNSSGALPAVPPLGSGGVPGAQSVAMSDSALGFQPSKAPLLDPSVSQFVAAPIIARYNQTASQSGSAGVAPITYVASNGPAVGPSGHSRRGMGGPETMSGAVVANFDSLQSQSVTAPSVYSDVNGLPPSASVFFSHDTTILSADAKAQVQSTAQAYVSRGGAGYVRVVGYSSSNSTKLSAARRMEWNLERSQARANAVARELIKDGVPADRVLIEGRGDAQGTADNGRRADIYIQG